MLKEEKNMLRELLRVNSDKTRMFQVLLLRNDASQEVEIQEANEVDFLKVQEHLKQGGSVFITSKNSQKLNITEEMKRAHRNRIKMKTVTAFYFDHV
jgi:hypothetical protein